MTSRLTARDRAFFARVARAAFANPFGQERETLDAELAEANADDPLVLERLSKRLATRLAELAPRGRVRIDEFDGDDRELVLAAIMFHVFHRHRDALDEHIDVEQRASAPQPLRFANDVLRELGEHGQSPAEAVRMLELFYQMARAHAAVRTLLVGSGPSMRRVREELWNALFTRDIRRYERYLWSRMEDFSTLLVGETGTGKGQAALAIGRSAFIAFDDKRGAFRERPTDLFLPVHLTELAETLLESELFGHKKGAFTGAIDHHRGVFARVKPHGTVFLDEIGEISLPVQVKLLRVLQDREFTPVGGHEPERFLGRVVAATHRSFAALREAGAMRDDFYYRLSTNTIELPPLRVRIAESPGELRHMIGHLCARIVGEPSPALTDEVHASVLRDLGPDHAFPGNVRELEQCVRRVLLTGHCATPGAASPPKNARDTLIAAIDRGELSAEALVAQYCALLYARSSNYVEVGRMTGLDRRTVKKHVDEVLGRR